MRIKNNIWQHKKTDSTGVDWFYCTFAGFEGYVDFSGYTVLIRNATVQTVFGILFEKKRQVFTSCIGKWFNNYWWQSYFPCPIKLINRTLIHRKNKFLHIHQPRRFASCRECFQLREFKFCKNIQESSKEMKNDTF